MIYRGRTRSGARRASREEGFVLFLAMLMLLVLTIAGISLMFASASERSLSSHQTMVSKTFYAADSGVQYATAKLSTDVKYVGGKLPVGLSTHYPGGTSADIEVTVTRPVNVGYTIHPGDQIQSQGASYGSNQIVENYYNFSSTAQAPTIQSRKTVTTAVGIYPQLLAIPQ
jgi:Tfp pilus assembly protein PilX